ncbi:hypothetical protein [Propioniciclava sinopodophylli]|uniref:hypothetical protein n=1 Tax=Propioniciclava sinopodophylli TaxID=1837344 RepID=UPI0024939F0A|nr:hypothetical protein [Propioniciclava sinopodophylli]
MIRSLVRKVTYAIIGGLAGFIVGIGVLTWMMGSETTTLACHDEAQRTYQEFTTDIKHEIAYWQDRLDVAPDGPAAEVATLRVISLTEQLSGLPVPNPRECTSPTHPSFLSRANATQTLLAEGPGRILTWPVILLTTFTGVALPLLPRRNSSYNERDQAEDEWWRQADRTPMALLDETGKPSLEGSSESSAARRSSSRR